MLLVLFYSWIGPCCNYTFLDIFIHFINMSIHLLSTGLVHWDILWQNREQLWVNYSLQIEKFHLNVSYWEFSHCHPVNQYKLLSAHGGCFVDGLLPWVLVITKTKHHPRAALCLQNRGIIFVPKKWFTRPAAGPIPGGHFIQRNLGWQDWSFKASQISTAWLLPTAYSYSFSALL